MSADLTALARRALACPGVDGCWPAFAAALQNAREAQEAARGQG